MSEETTTDRLAEIEGQAEDTPATEYTPPEGWRVLAVGEVLLEGDEWVNWEGTVSRPDILHGDGTTASGGRYIRQIKPEPQPEPQPNAAAIEELRSEVAYVQNLLGESRQRVTHLEELVTSLRTINRVCENAVRDAGKENTALRNQLAAVKAELANVAADRQQLRVELDAAQQVPADSPELQQLRERFAKLVASQEQITAERDAMAAAYHDSCIRGEQVNAELQQLRADLAEVTQDRDTYRDGYERVLSDLQTIRETAKAEAVEAIAEWLEPIRAVDNPNLANETLQHLPQIMRSLTGLAQD